MAGSSPMLARSSGIWWLTLSIGDARHGRRHVQAQVEREDRVALLDADVRSVSRHRSVSRYRPAVGLSDARAPATRSWPPRTAPTRATSQVDAAQTPRRRTRSARRPEVHRACLVWRCRAAHQAMAWARYARPGRRRGAGARRRPRSGRRRKTGAGPARPARRSGQPDGQAARGRRPGPGPPPGAVAAANPRLAGPASGAVPAGGRRLNPAPGAGTGRRHGRRGRAAAGPGPA